LKVLRVSKAWDGNPPDAVHETGVVAGTAVENL